MHPLGKEGRVIEGIRMERDKLQKLREKATNIIDTSNLPPKQLREVIRELVSENSKYEGLILSVISFGFKHGMLMDADMVFDVRFLPNPFYIEELKDHTGQEAVIRDYLSMFPETHVFIRKLDEMLEFLIPYFIKEGKNRLVVGIGCTGGVHRSVAIADAACDMLRRYGHHVTLEHRDINEKR